MNPLVCSACGARLAPGSTRCDLCGHDLADEPPHAAETARDDAAEPMPEAVPTPPEASAAPDPFCTQCGTKNPAYARFCYQCGHALHGTEHSAEAAPAAAGAVPVVPAVLPAASNPPARPDSDAGKRAFALIGAGVLAVLVLFFLTRAGQNRAAAPAPAAATTSPAASAAAPLPDDVAARAAELEDEIAVTDGDERLAKQEELVRLLAQAAAFPRAARVQEEVAEAQQTALAWADAGSFYLAAMLRTEGPERATLARQSAAAYERSLELDPADLDVKTDLATAYLNDAQNPMKAVETVKEVLAEEPGHVRANFNYGLMLAQINRVPQAREQFEKVVALTEPGDPVYERAEQELARLRAVGTANG